MSRKVNAKKSPSNRATDRRRQSTLLMFSQEPSEELRNLYWACEYGDVPGVEALLTQHPNIDADTADVLGRTAIQIAVVNEHAEIVELLLERSNEVNLYEALLLAITHNYENITEIILKNPTYRPYINRWPELAARLPETSPFSDDISPIILACQKNLFGVVHLLWQEGMRIPPPHNFDCTCERCAPDSKLATSRDQLKHAKRGLNEFRALTSEAYISLTSNDPFQTAFELSHQMEKRAAQEKHFKKEYKELAARLKVFVVKLLDNVRTHAELTTILNCHSVNTQFSMAEPMELQPINNKNSRRISVIDSHFHATRVKTEPLARLRVAIQYKQKDFVAHWSCQQELMRRWLRGFNQQGASGQSMIFLHLFFIVLAYPVLLCFHWVAPNSKGGQLLSRPLVKFVAYSVSYLCFLGILCLITINLFGCYSGPEHLSQMGDPNYTLLSAIGRYCHDFCGNCSSHSAHTKQLVDGVGQLSRHGVLEICHLATDFVIRPQRDNWMSWLASIWLLGLLFRKLFEVLTRDIPSCLNQKWASICRSPFDFVDYVVLAVFAAAAIYRFFSYCKTMGAISFFIDEPISNETLSQFPSKLYWITADRCYFDPLDPLTLSEILFAIGAVFSFSRLLYIFPVFEVFGPCYLALMRVVNDIFAFSFVFLVVFAAFLIGTMNVYWYFDPSLRLALQVNATHNPRIPAERRFGGIELTFRTVFWSLFGLGESDYMNLGNFANGSMMWVERIGYIMYGAYNIVVVCVLLNMLIAMMANSYEAIKINSEMEWKFARTILFLEYIPEYSPTVPTPFNLVPNPRYISKVTKRLTKLIRLEKSRTKALPFLKPAVSFDVDDDAQPQGLSALSAPIVRFSLSTPQLSFEAQSTTDEEDDEDRNPMIMPSLAGGVASLRSMFPMSMPKFTEAIHKIVKRFVMSWTIQGNSGTVDLEEIKQDISSFRFEVLDALSKSSEKMTRRTSLAESFIVRHKPQEKAKATPGESEPREADLTPPSSPRRRWIVPYRRNHLLSSTTARGSSSLGRSVSMSAGSANENEKALLMSRRSVQRRLLGRPNSGNANQNRNAPEKSADKSANVSANNIPRALALPMEDVQEESDEESIEFQL